MKNCESCKWDREGECKQGHVRWNRDKRWIIEDCHAWEEKPDVCKWCDEWRESRKLFQGTSFWKTLSYLINCSDILQMEKCPNCGKKLGVGK